MTIETCYGGRLGNHFFRYTFARLLAEKNRLYLNTKWCHPDIIKTTKHKPGEKIEFPDDIQKVKKEVDRRDLVFLKSIPHSCLGSDFAKKSN